MLKITTLPDFEKLVNILEKYFLSITDKSESSIHFAGATVFFKYRTNINSMSIVEGNNLSYAPKNPAVFLSRAIVEILKAQEDVLGFPENYTWSDKLKYILSSIERDISDNILPGFVFAKKALPFEKIDNIDFKI